MRDEETQIAPISVTNGGLVKKEASDGGIFGRGKYKFWALVAILLLAFWSMFTGSVTLKWSSGNLNRVSDDFDSRIHKDLDILVCISSFLCFFFFFLTRNGAVLWVWAGN